MAEVRTKHFSKLIQNELFAGNEFVSLSTSFDGQVEDDQIEIPQTGSIPKSTKDRVIVPAEIKKRTDTKKTIDLNEYTMDPFYVPNIDKIQLSYDKSKSLMAQMIAIMGEDIARNFLNSISGIGLTTAAGEIVLTTGTDTADIMPLQTKDEDGTVTGVIPSGNRKAVKLTDITKLAAKLDSDHVPPTGRYLMMPSRMYHNMLDENEELENIRFSPNSKAVEEGIVKKIKGFNILVRPDTTIYLDGATPTVKAVTAVSAAADVYGAIAWHPDFVAKAWGRTEFFADKNVRPEYYGKIMSALTMFTSFKLRTSNAGIVSLVQNS